MPNNDYTPRINIGQSFVRKTGALFFLFDPRVQRLLDDPSFGSFQASRHLIDFFGEL